MSTQALDEYRRTVREIADAVAPGWERRRGYIETSTTAVREWMLRALAPQPGQTLLELACGAGDTGFDASALTGDGGRLISSDISPVMLDVARRRGAERGVPNVDYRLLDLERVELGDDTVDGVLCRFAYMLVADPVAAFAETRRVLRPGGRVVLAVWGAPDRNPFFTALGMGLVEAGHVPPPDPSAPGIFSLGDPEAVRGLLDGAGFTDVRVEEVAVRFAFGDVDEYVAIHADASGPMALVLRGLSEAERAQLAESLAAGLAPFRSGQGYEVPPSPWSRWPRERRHRPASRPRAPSAAVHPGRRRPPRAACCRDCRGRSCGGDGAAHARRGATCPARPARRTTAASRRCRTRPAAAAAAGCSGRRR